MTNENTGSVHRSTRSPKISPTQLSAYLALLLLLVNQSLGLRLRSVEGYGSFPFAYRARVNQTSYPWGSANRSQVEWGVGLSWDSPIRTDIYYGQLPLVYDVQDLVNGNGVFLGRYRTEARVAYVSAPCMYRLALFRAGDSSRNRGTTATNVSLTLDGMVGPRLDVYLARYIGGFGDETGWTYGGPDPGSPRVKIDVPVVPLGLGAELALVAGLALGRLIVDPEIRLRLNVTNPSSIGFSPNVIVPAFLIGMGYAF